MTVLLFALSGLAGLGQSSAATGQEIVIEGYVCEGEGYGQSEPATLETARQACAAPIPKARVRLDLRGGRSVAAVTDAKGRFELAPLSPEDVKSSTVTVDADDLSGFSGFPLAPSRVDRPRLVISFTLPGLVSFDRFDLAEAGRSLRPEERAEHVGQYWVSGGEPLRRFLQERIDGLTWLDLEGRTWSKRSLLGKVTLIDFWATWCGPCLREVPFLRDAAAADRSHRLQILGVSLDTDRTALKAYAEKHRVRWPQVFDGAGFEGQIAVAFGIDAIPRNIVVDGEGRVVGVNLRGRGLEKVLSGLMKAAPAMAPTVR